MKKLMLICLSVALVVSCPARSTAKTAPQDTVVVQHNAYTSVFAESAHIPVIVTYVLHKDQVRCSPKIERTNNFRADPAVPGTALGKDYSGSGYDQGHNMSAEDNACSSVGMSECFYFTNMFPQVPKLNRGIWKSLEVQERSLAFDYDSVIVIIGSFGIDKIIGPDKVVVPKYCWKAIYIPALKEWRVYSFPNYDMNYPFGVASGDTGFDKYDLPDGQAPWVRHCIDHFTGYRY